MMLTNLADILRSAGLRVQEVGGWQSRSNDGNRFAGVRSIVCHWTATPPTAGGNYPSLNVVTYGRSDLPGMLAQLGLGRDGTWYVIGAGVAWHAGQVDSVDHDNWHAVGIEAEYHPDQGPWPDVQQRSYERGCAALARAYGVPVWQIQGHYEVARPIGRKSDPNTLPGGMPGFRDRVAAVLNGTQEDDVMPAEDPNNPFLRASDSIWLDTRRSAGDEWGDRRAAARHAEEMAALAALAADPDITPDAMRETVMAAEREQTEALKAHQAQLKEQQTAELKAHIDSKIADVDEAALAEQLEARGIGGVNAEQVKAALAEVLRGGTDSVPHS